MRLATVETLLVRHALSRPTGPAGAYNSERRTIVVKLTTTDGLVNGFFAVPTGRGLGVEVDEE